MDNICSVIFPALPWRERDRIAHGEEALFARMGLPPFVWTGSIPYLRQQHLHRIFDMVEFGVEGTRDLVHPIPDDPCDDFTGYYLRETDNGFNTESISLEDECEFDD